MRTRSVLAATAALALGLSWSAGPAEAAAGTSYTWIGSSQDSSADNHSWGDPKNWIPTGVPGEGDSVTIVSPNASHCTAHVDGVPTVSLAAFSLSENPNLCGTSVHGGAITVTHSFTWDGGNLDSPTTIAGGATGVVSGTDTRLNSLTQNLDVAGSVTLAGAAGTAALRITAPQVLHVLPGATLSSTGDNDVTFTSCCVAPAKVVNDGTIAVGSGRFQIDAVELDQLGAVATSDAGELLTTSAPITTGENGSYSGNGRWAIEDHASAHFSGTQSLGPGFHLELGGLSVDTGASLGGTATLIGSGVFDWTGGTVEANLTVAHGVSVHVSGAHTGNGRRILQGQDFTGTSSGASATVTNHGTITVDQGASFTTGARATLANAGDGTLSLAPGTQLDSGGCCVNPDRITSTGKIVVPAGASTAPVVIHNIAVQANGGSTSVATARTLQLTGGAPNRLSSTTVTGGGLVSITAPTAVSGTVTIGSSTRLQLDAHGSLDGTATLSGRGGLRWTGGSISGAVTVTTGLGVAISGTAVKYLANIGGGTKPSRLTLHAHTTIAAGTSAAHDVVDLGSSTLTLESSTTASAYADFHNGAALVNTGTLTASPGSANTVYKSGGGLLVNRGTVAVTSGTLLATSGYRQTAGTTSLSSGAVLSAAGTGVTMSGGVLGGTGTVTAGVSNAGGKVEPGFSSIGSLHIKGSYAQASKGTLVVDLTTHSRHDMLAVTGPATIKGTLLSHDLSGYHPASATTRTAVKAGSVHYSLSCAISSGTDTAGSHAGHWAPAHSSTRLWLVWHAGTDTHC